MPCCLLFLVTGASHHGSRLLFAAFLYTDNCGFGLWLQWYLTFFLWVVDGLRCVLMGLVAL
jgi:hypothetical protein